MRSAGEVGKVKNAGCLLDTAVAQARSVVASTGFSPISEVSHAFRQYDAWGRCQEKWAQALP